MSPIPYKIREQLSKADKLLVHGCTYSAAAIWAELWAIADGDGRMALSDKLCDEVAALDVAQLQREVTGKAARIDRILFSAGNRFIAEEIALVLSMRVDVEQIQCLLAAFRPDAELDVSLEDCDEALQDIARSAKNKADYRTAARSFTKAALAALHLSAN
tara:strand:- start:3463 stop:3942 length:480 start_codon:yes stop_codon:yes gene_type:complete